MTELGPNIHPTFAVFPYHARASPRPADASNNRTGILLQKSKLFGSPKPPTPLRFKKTSSSAVKKGSALGQQAATEDDEWYDLDDGSNTTEAPSPFPKTGVVADLARELSSTHRRQAAKLAAEGDYEQACTLYQRAIRMLRVSDNCNRRHIDRLQCELRLARKAIKRETKVADAATIKADEARERKREIRRAAAQLREMSDPDMVALTAGLSKATMGDAEGDL